MKDLELLEKNFVRLMKNKDFSSFKKTHPTLIRVILESMKEKEKKTKH